MASLLYAEMCDSFGSGNEFRYDFNDIIKVNIFEDLNISLREIELFDIE